VCERRQSLLRRVGDGVERWGEVLMRDIKKKTFRSTGEGSKAYLGELKAYLRQAWTIPLAILLVETRWMPVATALRTCIMRDA
jgi:hypothetical protein